MTDAEKVRENRVRRMAQRQGYVLRKSRRRDPRALDYGAYWLIEPSRNIPVVGTLNGASLDEIEDWLTSD